MGERCPTRPTGRGLRVIASRTDLLPPTRPTYAKDHPPSAALPHRLPAHLYFSPAAAMQDRRCHHMTLSLLKMAPSRLPVSDTQHP